MIEPRRGDHEPAVVFGGAGFIGTHLLRHLKAQGRTEVVCADIADPAERIEGVEYLFTDVRAPISADIVSRTPEIYDLAAIHRTPGHDDHEYYETNISGAINIADFALKVGANKLSFTSSIAVYGPDEEAKTENSPLQPVSAYGWSKRLAEDVYRSWQAQSDAHRLTIVRPAVVFGKGERGNFTRLADALRRGFFVFPGRADTIKACGYVGELLRTLEFVNSYDRPYSLYNFCYPKKYTIDEICETFSVVGGLKRPRGKVPLFLLNTAAIPFEVGDALGLKNSINRQRIQKLVRSTNIEPGFLVESGYEYETELAEGLRRWRDCSDRQFK